MALVVTQGRACPSLENPSKGVLACGEAWFGLEKAYLSRVRSSRIHCPRVLLAWDLPHAHGQTRVWTLPPGHYQPQCGTPPESNPSLCPTGPFLCLGRGSPSADQNSLCPGGVPAAAVAWNSRQTDSPGGSTPVGPPKAFFPKLETSSLSKVRALSAWWLSHKPHNHGGWKLPPGKFPSPHRVNTSHTLRACLGRQA